jgi:hypothetical protein
MTLVSRRRAFGSPQQLWSELEFSQSGLPGKFTWAIFETWAVIPVDPLSLTLNLEIPPSDMKDNAKTNWLLSDHALAALDLRTTLTSDRSFASPERTTYWTSKYGRNGLEKKLEAYGPYIDKHRSRYHLIRCHRDLVDL